MKPIIWTIAGSDSGGGAGLQADLNAFKAFHVHGCTVVSAITSQHSTAVLHIESTSPSVLNAQLEALSQDMPPHVIKCGMLGSVDNIMIVAEWVIRLRLINPALKLVIDPVLKASTGALLVDSCQMMIEAYLVHLFPLATVITPNRQEANVLIAVFNVLNQNHQFHQLKINDDIKGIKHLADTLKQTGCESVVITGGDETGLFSEDYCDTPQFKGYLRLPRLDSRNNHGTGCTFASSCAAALGLGFVSADAIVLAKMATTYALSQGYAVGQGAGVVCANSAFSHLGEFLPYLFDDLSLKSKNKLKNNNEYQYPRLINPDLGLYAVVESSDWVKRVIECGVKTVQLRIKRSNDNNCNNNNNDNIFIFNEIKRSLDMIDAFNRININNKNEAIQFFINDEWAYAIQLKQAGLNVYGVHLGQEDLLTADLHAIARAGLRLGISTHSAWEVCRALSFNPSYIACGPIYPTDSKDMPWIAQGIDNLSYWCEVLFRSKSKSKLSIPVVAIGGINIARAVEVAQTGVNGIAVITAITKSIDVPETAIIALNQSIQEGRANLPLTVPHLPRTTLNY